MTIIAQSVFSPWTITQYPVPEFGLALLSDIKQRVETAYREKHNISIDLDIFEYVTDAFAFRVFDWTVEDWYIPKPNISFGGVDFWYYIYSGNGCYMSKELSPDEWVKWYDNLLESICTE